MRIWVDDVRPAPAGYLWAKSVNGAKERIEMCEDLYEDTSLSENTRDYYKIEVIDLDHDAGDYAVYGGDFIKLLDWLEETGRNYPIRIHSMNPVGRENMRRIIKRNGWTEVDYGI